MTLGLSNYPCRATPAQPHYCPKCMGEDIKNYGFAWYRREHQLPGVAVCYQHKMVLADNCSRSGPFPIKGMALRMPDRCLCSEGISPLPVSPNLSMDSEPLLWLAKQSTYLVNSSGTHCNNIRATLRDIVIRQGYGRGSLVEPNKLATAIEKRFGRKTLEWLNTPVWKDSRPAPWVRRLLLNNSVKQKRSPTLLYLLIIGVIFESAKAFETAQALSPEVKSVAEENASNLLAESSPKKLRPGWSNDVLRILQEGKCGVPGISKRLGVPVHLIIQEVRQNGWRVPLSRQTRKNLGENTIAAIRNDLRRGIKKSKIVRNHGCSSWALLLIELDLPGLNKDFYNASRLHTQARNRDRLSHYISTNPTATRSDIFYHLSGVYDYLIEHDKEWFHSQIPRKKPTATTPRKEKADGNGSSLLDQRKASEICRVFELMLESDNKPIWATGTAAFKRANLLQHYANNQNRFPRVTEVIMKHSESRSEFIRRRIIWAVEQMATAETNLSVNKLRRIAGFSAQIIKDHSQLVIKYASQRNATIDGKSHFAKITRKTL